ncbi:MAG: PAS domain-containing protein [Spirochaetota bacterium]
MNNLNTLLLDSEDWLMERILYYAQRQSYTKYTSTLIEAWRISIQGLTEALCTAISSDRSLELTPDESFSEDPVSAFGIIEAQKHRARGISLQMFMGLFKYYRESYCDLIRHHNFPQETADKYILFISRAFDRIEIGFCAEWAKIADDARLNEIMEANRYMTNEKNMYLTVTESIASPVVVIDDAGKVTYINSAASKMLGLSSVPGGYYYNRNSLDIKLPDRINRHVRSFIENTLTDFSFECDGEPAFPGLQYQGTIAAMKDVSGKFSGTVIILTDVTAIKDAEKEIHSQKEKLEDVLFELKVLHGILPICSHCKKIRDPKGGWSPVEQYMHKHTDAEFSHSLCPECAEKLYPGILTKGKDK